MTAAQAIVAFVHNMRSVPGYNGYNPHQFAHIVHAAASAARPIWYQSGWTGTTASLCDDSMLHVDFDTQELWEGTNG